MAGSYKHCVTALGQLRTESLPDMIENMGDFYEAIEEMYGMIWYLADGNPARVDAARDGYQIGLEQSPGLENAR